MQFQDRAHAGGILARHILTLGLDPDRLIVLALPRGGVPVAARVAHALGAPLDVLLVRKVGTPGHPELAMAAIASGGGLVLNDDVIAAFEVDPEAIDAAVRFEQAELERRERIYRGGHPFPEITGHTVVVIDDGLATGASMRAAALALRQKAPRALIVAVPVAPESTVRELSAYADRVECLSTPEHFHAVGEFYEDFSQVSDAEVLEHLGAYARAA